MTQKLYWIVISIVLGSGTTLLAQSTEAPTSEEYLLLGSANPNGAAPAEITIGGGSPTLFSRVSRNRPIDRVILASTDNEVRWKKIVAAGRHHRPRRPKRQTPELRAVRAGVALYGTGLRLIRVRLAETGI